MNYYISAEKATYDLTKTTTFYADLASYTDNFLQYFNSTTFNHLKEVINYLVQNRPAYTREEHIVHLLMTGVFSNSFISYANNSNTLLHLLASTLTSLRKTPQIKNSVDMIRGKINTRLFSAPQVITEDAYSFDKLLTWLQSCGDFKEEVKQITPIVQWLSMQESRIQNEFRIELHNMTYHFINTAANELGKYTSNVVQFICNNIDYYQGREDIIYAMREEPHYHLNMVGAEIMNRSLLAEFKSKKIKVVLLSACMRGENQKRCKAEKTHLGLKCVQCNRHCNLGNTAQKLAQYTVDTYLVPHSSGFSQSLKLWKERKDVALIAAACVLNLLQGGYQMKNLDIAAQCVFLNFSGCKKHWCNFDQATTLNSDRLLELITL